MNQMTFPWTSLAECILIQDLEVEHEESSPDPF